MSMCFEFDKKRKFGFVLLSAESLFSASIEGLWKFEVNRRFHFGRLDFKIQHVSSPNAT